jgi:hypothetical protein
LDSPSTWRWDTSPDTGAARLKAAALIAGRSQSAAAATSMIRFMANLFFLFHTYVATYVLARLVRRGRIRAALDSKRSESG